MSSFRKSSPILVLLVCFGAMLMVETALATPEGSQRLRGLGGRIFFVQVEVLENVVDIPVGTTFPNCYSFLADGTWIDPGFLPPPDPVIPGSWGQHSTGAATSYSASAGVPTPDGLLLLSQEGVVTPAKGGGVLQIDALSVLTLEGFPLASFHSVGYEVETCPL